jgi:cytochrome P450
MMTATNTPKRVPGPVGSPYLFFLSERPRVRFSMMRRFLGDPLQYLVDAAREYGDVVCLDPGHVYLINRPEYVQHVLQDNHLNYCKGPSYKFISDVLGGTALLTSDGEAWRRQRRLVQPAFQRHHTSHFATMMSDAVGGMLDRWAIFGDRPFPIRAQVNQLTMDIFLKTMFSADLGTDVKELTQAFLTVDDQINPAAAFVPVQIPLTLPTPGNLRYRRAIRTVEAFVYRIIAERRHRQEDAGDLLAALLDARDEETGDALSDKQARDQVLSMLNAGHALTCDGITWTLHLLSQHASIARRLEEEIDTIAGDRPTTFADVQQLTYTSMVIQESMRLYPPSWGIGRTAIHADAIDGYAIPANGFVAISPYVIHRLPALWDNPDLFDPDRFSPARSEGHRFAYFPFGSGPRICPAVSYALLETALVIAMVAQRYRIEQVPGQRIAPRPRMSLQPHPDIWMTLHKRRP